jgi:hypothetical protein
MKAMILTAGARRPPRSPALVPAAETARAGGGRGDPDRRFACGVRHTELDEIGGRTGRLLIRSSRHQIVVVMPVFRAAWKVLTASGWGRLDPSACSRDLPRANENLRRLLAP